MPHEHLFIRTHTSGCFRDEQNLIIEGLSNNIKKAIEKISKITTCKYKHNSEYTFEMICKFNHEDIQTVEFHSNLNSETK